MTEKCRIVRICDATGLWTEYVVRDDANTEVAEQTFAKFDMFAPAVKGMRSAVARLFIARIDGGGRAQPQDHRGSCAQGPKPASCGVHAAVAAPAVLAIRGVWRRMRVNTRQA